jgi:hypothetical protein
LTGDRSSASVPWGIVSWGVVSAAFLLAASSVAAPCQAVPGLDHLTCTEQLPLLHLAPIQPLSAARKAKMVGVVWTSVCPVSLEQLSVVPVPYIDPSGHPRQGELVVATNIAEPVRSIFIQLYQARFPIAGIQPMEVFGGNDEAAMAANNTSSFNCRHGPESGRWSRHAYGDAIDLNPLWNPQIRETRISPAAGEAFRDRTVVLPGMNVRDGTSVRIFRAAGWRWGGRWPKPKDYQHFCPGNL